MELISREAAIEALKYSFGDADNISDVVYWSRGQVLTVLNNLPTVEPRWIPVSEGLPDYGEYVLLSVCGCCTVGKCEYVNGINVDWYYDGWYHQENDVDAWMPLPEPWEGEENDNL